MIALGMAAAGMEHSEDLWNEDNFDVHDHPQIYGHEVVGVVRAFKERSTLQGQRIRKQRCMSSCVCP